MNKTLVGLTLSFLCLLVATAGGCMTAFESRFFDKFSLNELVKRNASVVGLNCSSGAGGGGMSMGAGGIGKDHSHFSRTESMGCQIADATQFDESKLIQALKQTIEQDLGASKAEIVKSDSREANSFSLQYTLEKIAGRVEISGTRSGNFYTLKADLEEKNSAK
ncbi:MAG TPA: hypothetical protein VF075_09040 [Pyrinomonadaceae bacterium]